MHSLVAPLAVGFLGTIALAPVASALQKDEPTTEELMRAARVEFGRRAKRYASMVEKAGNAVEAAVAENTWRSGPGEGKQLPLAHHPLLAHVGELEAGAKGMVEGRKNSEPTIQKLKLHPWASQLEFLISLAKGAERAIPDHDNGFIDLGRSPMPPPGWPDLLTNHYLYGLEEIVGWQYGVEDRKRPSYRGRESKDRPVLTTELPSWEELRVYLEGSTPATALYGVPRFTHMVHSRLAERRSKDEGATPHMDDFLVMLDSKWNGFQFEVPETGERVAFVQPVHWLFIDGKGFVFQFPRAEPLARAGDIPFFSVQTYSRFADLYLGQRVGFGDFIAFNEKARQVQAAFSKEQRSLSRYKALIDVFGRAILAPNLRYPTYLSAYDYPDGAMPLGREIDYDFDMPRRHAILVWAYVGKDPAALADFLYDHLFTREDLRFPSQEGLAVQLTLMVRQMEEELVRGVAERIAQEREGEAVLNSPGYEVGDYEREFSPYPEYRALVGRPSAAYLAYSFHEFHRPIFEHIRAAAREVVEEATKD